VSNWMAVGKWRSRREISPWSSGFLLGGLNPCLWSWPAEERVLEAGERVFCCAAWLQRFHSDEERDVALREISMLQ
jgi:hypothetical protein